MNAEIQSFLLSLPQSKLIPLSKENFKSIENMKTCRTHGRGGMILVCPECDIKAVFYNPCNQRGCALCYQKNQIQWKQRLQGRILPTSHYHLVFSFPEVFTDIWLHEKRKMIKSLFASVAVAIKELGDKHGILLGYALVFHSHGKGLAYKPHIHCLLSSGGATEDHRWITLGSIPYNMLIDAVKKTIDKQLRKNELPIELLPDYGRIRDDEWKLHPVLHQDSGNQIVEYLSHSMHGVVVDLDHDVKIDQQKQTVEVITRHNGKEEKTTLSLSLFAERYLQHIPPSGAVMVRYYGLYSNSHKEELEYIRQKSFKERIEKHGEEDGEEIEDFVEKCPKCHAPMKIFLVLEPQTMLDLTFLGFMNDPPKHREVLRSA